MPYCCQCGTPASAVDRFCAKCGAPQPAANAGGPQTPRNDGSFNPYYGGSPAASISPKNASILCYIPWFGWIACVLVLATNRFKQDKVEGPEVRFHAFQGLFLFVAWLIVDWIISPMAKITRMMPGPGVLPFRGALGGILHLLILAAWIVMLIKVSHNEHYRLPIIGEMAERSVHEQRG